MTGKPTTAYCPGCRKTKDIATGFGKEKRTRAGHAKFCKDCEAARKRRGTRGIQHVVQGSQR